MEEDISSLFDTLIERANRDAEWVFNFCLVSPETVAETEFQVMWFWWRGKERGGEFKVRPFGFDVGGRARGGKEEWPDRYDDVTD